MFELRREASRARIGVAKSNRIVDEVNKKILHNIECEKAGEPLPYSWAELHNEAENARKESGDIIKGVSDEAAVFAKDLFGEWDPNKEYTEGDRFFYNGNLYRCKKKNPVNPTWTPDVVHEYYEPVTKPEEDGTIDNPVVAVAGMSYEEGKYYAEGDKVYICTRSAVLHFLPSALVGHYFEEVTG